MSNMLNDTMHAAKNGVESARESTMHALGTAKQGVESARESTMHTVASAASMIVKGGSTVAGIVAMLQKLDRDDGLAWFGLARRRSPLVTVAVFGAGAALGAGIALLLAPSSGADLRRTLLGRSSGDSVATKAGDAAKKVGDEVEDAAAVAVAAVKGAAGDVKEALAGAPHNGVSKSV